MYAARSGYTVAVVEQMSAGGQMATTETVENYPGFDDGIDGFELGERMQRGAERFGVVTVYAKIKSLNLKASPKTVETTAGMLNAKAVVIATGQSPDCWASKEKESLRAKAWRTARCATVCATKAKSP